MKENKTVYSQTKKWGTEMIRNEIDMWSSINKDWLNLRNIF
jgi:hypothetical protein